MRDLLWAGSRVSFGFTVTRIEVVIRGYCLPYSLLQKVRVCLRRGIRFCQGLAFRTIWFAQAEPFVRAMERLRAWPVQDHRGCLEWDRTGGKEGLV